MDSAKKLATYDDLLALPDGLTGELIYGELHTQPRPANRHGIVESGLSGELSGPFARGRGGPGGWLFITEPELHLSSHVLVPDLAGWRRDRAVGVAEAVHTDIRPDWVCEILSPSTAAKDRALKLPLYGQLEVPYAWYIDPGARTVEAYKLDRGRWTLLSTASGNAKLTAEPFDAIAVELAALWGE